MSDDLKVIDLGLDNMPDLPASIRYDLYKNGVNNTMVLACQTTDFLTNIGIRKRRAQKIIIQARQIADEYMEGKTGFVNGDAFIKRYEKGSTMSSGCPSLDNILGGGFKTKRVYDIYGPSGTGKSFLMHQLACRSLLPIKSGGLRSPAVIYIDINQSFYSKRIFCIAHYYGLNDNKFCKNFHIARPTTTDALLYLCEHHLLPIVKESKARIIIFDAMSTNFFCEIGTDKRLIPIMQNKLYRIINCLTTIAVDYNCLVLIVNGVMDNFYDHGDKYIHLLKYYMQYDSPYLIRLDRHDTGIRKFTLEKGIGLQQNECLLELTQFGFTECKRDY